MKKHARALVPVLVLLLASAAVLVFYSILSTGAGSSPDALPTFTSSEQFMSAFTKGQGDGWRGGQYDLAMPATATAGATEKTNGSADHSTTNVQVAGVDEADLVKNDGKFIYVISGQSVIIMAAYPPREAAVLSRIEFDRNSRLAEMFLAEDRLVVIGSSYNSEPRVYEENDYSILPMNSTTFIKIYDVRDRENPRLARTVEYEGDYATARMIGNDIHAVLTTYPYYYQYDEEDLTPASIIPKFRDVRGDREGVGFSPACDYTEVAYTDPDAFSSFLSIVSLSLDDGVGSLKKQVITGYSENVYASLANLYIAASDYQYYGYRGPYNAQEEKTTIYKFRLDGPETVFAGSAEVPGTVLNQFSMDEWNGSFRIATTRGHVSREGSNSTNNVYVLDSDLNVTGKLEGLAPGETIYSARFLGKRAYLVTFKKVDPFFVLDLSNPADPKVLGALKIPGFSDYLHPYDENHVIGVGKNTVEAAPGEGNFAWYQGMKVALFDVTDVANPKEMYKVEIGDRGTDSYALSDHKAFLFDRDKGLLVLPVLLAELTPEQKAAENTRAHEYGNYTYQGAYVYDISLAAGIVLKGRVTHLDDLSELNGSSYYYDSSNSIKRSLYIGDYLYTVSDARVKINQLEDLAEVVSIRLGK